MSGPVTRIALFTLILLGVSACDNVEWGGIQVELEAAAVADSTLLETDAEVEEAGPTGPVLPAGPVVFTAQTTDGGRVAVRPLASVGQNTLISIPLEGEGSEIDQLLVRERMAPGTRYTLFAEGTRVGTVTAEAVEYRSGRCADIPYAVGTVELIPAAVGVERFIALPEGQGEPQQHLPFVQRDHTYDQRVAGLRLATDAIGLAGATWPQSVLETRADMQGLSLDGDPTGALAATFLFQDALRVGTSLTRAAWSIFVLGTGGPASYQMGFMAYRPVSEGKGAMRYFEQADWDGDGQTEIVVEVFGEESRWFLALDRQDGPWQAVHEDRCG